jgi:hypothetical protein
MNVQTAQVNLNKLLVIIDVFSEEKVNGKDWQ